MAYLTSNEALHASDCFLSSLYGEDVYRRWKELKQELQFEVESEFVSWLIDVAIHYKNGDESAYLLEDPSKVLTVTSGMNADQVAKIEKYEGQRVTGLDGEYNNEVRRNTCYNQSNVPASHTRSKKYYRVESATTGKVQNIEGVKRENIGTSTDLTNVHSKPNYALADGGLGELQDEQVDVGNVVTYDAVDASSTPAALLAVHGDEEGMSVSADSGHRVFKCSHCNYASQTQFHVRRHITAVHERRRDNPCQHCAQRFSTLDNLHRHLKTRHGITGQFCCTQCNKLS